MPFRRIDEEDPEPESRVAKAVIGGAGERLVDNILGIPKTITRGLAQTFEPPHILKPEGGVEQMEGYRAPENILNLPSGRRVLSQVDFATGAAATPQDAMQARAELEQQHPFATTIGGLLGDASMVMAARRPAVRAGNSTDILAPHVQRHLEKALKPEIAERFGRVLGRMGEGATEAGILAELQNTDPVAAAGYAAGVQAASMAGLAFSKVSGVDDLAHMRLIEGGKKFMGTAMAIGGLFQFIESGIPGDTEGWIQSVQSGFDKMIPLMAVGALSASMGGGRAGQGVPLFKGEMGLELTDALSSIPRTAWNTAIVDLVKNSGVRDLAQRFIDNPQSMTSDERRRVSDAFENGTLSDLAEEMKPKFRRLD